MPLLPVLILASQLADLAAFSLAVRMGGLDGELNPFAVALVVTAGMPMLVAVKVAAGLALGLIAVRLRPRWGLFAATVGLVGAMTGILAAW